MEEYHHEIYSGTTHPNSYHLKVQDFSKISTTDTFCYRPSCLDTLFMLPFPCFCIGCCTSQTTKLQFDRSIQILKVSSYSGHFCCFGEHEDIRFDEIMGVQIELHNDCMQKSDPSCRVYLVITSKIIFLTGWISQSKGKDVQKQLKEVMEQNDISLF